MRPIVVAFTLLLLSLSGCAPIVNYLYDAGILNDRLTVSMSKDQVVKEIGKPNRIIQDDGRFAVWEYRLYAKGEWAAYLIHCPWHLFCYFPIEPPYPYYVAFQENQLCLWGEPPVVQHLSAQLCDAAPISIHSSIALDAEKIGLRVSVIPVFMPSQIAMPIRRLAVIPLGGAKDPQLRSWLDFALNFFHSRHPQLVFVEREALATVLNEVGMQYTGRVEDETTVRVGKLSGADSLLTYGLAVTESPVPMSASFELRLLNVETGTTLFRQITTATASPSGPESAVRKPSQLNQAARHLIIDAAAAYGFASLAAALGDNPLGIVADAESESNDVKLLGLLQGSPANHAGLKKGDRILASNGRPVRNWTEITSLPGVLTIERGEERSEISFEVSAR